MKFIPSECPECGTPAKGTVDTVPGLALLVIDEDTGEAEYGGYTEVWWDDQTTDRDSQGRHALACENGHRWWAVLQELDEDPAASSPVIVVQQQ
jgi:hypothetical protein